MKTTTPFTGGIDLETLSTDQLVALVASLERRDEVGVTETLQTVTNLLVKRGA